MQKEAEDRVREMQSRARLVGNAEHKMSTPPFKKMSTQNENPLSSILKGIDSDKTIIIALLLILWNEKADQKLLLALLYLLIT